MLNVHAANTKTVPVGTLNGLTISRAEIDDNSIVLYTECGRIFALYHAQDCCEEVYIEDCPSEDWFKGLEVATLTEEFSDGEEFSSTYTFYTFTSKDDSAQVRFYGISNGYYSETADFVEILAYAN